jgi:hypothetical protein
MDHRPTQLERAFQLAKSGRCGSVKDIRDQLRSEGYSTTQITGKTLAGQLQAHIQTAALPLSLHTAALAALSEHRLSINHRHMNFFGAVVSKSHRGYRHGASLWAKLRAGTFVNLRHKATL